ncbi:MAG: cupin domain-containing protein [Gemmatimonadales bacterium]
MTTKAGQATQATLTRWDALPMERLNERLERRFIGGEHATLAQFHLAKGCIVPNHSHPNEQFTSVLSGVLRFRFGPDQARTIDVHAGEVLSIPGHLSHSAEALEDTVVLDVFCPPRADWIARDDAYLRG